MNSQQYDNLGLNPDEPLSMCLQTTSPTIFPLGSPRMSYNLAGKAESSQPFFLLHSFQPWHQSLGCLLPGMCVHAHVRMPEHAASTMRHAMPPGFVHTYTILCHGVSVGQRHSKRQLDRWAQTMCFSKDKSPDGLTFLHLL